jgi:hypothetical protein
MGYKLKDGFLDWGGGNRLNAVNHTEFEILPDCFINESTGIELSSFNTISVYNNTSCTYRIDDSGARRIFITPQTSNNQFSFALTNGGTLIYGFALESLPETDISISLVKNILGETSTTVGGLCTSSKKNIFSPRKPNGNVPYKLGDFRGYCHNASGGVNIYNGNGIDVPYLSTYSLYGAATRNQEVFSTTTLNIYQDNVLKGTVNKNITYSPFIEKSVTGLTNNNYWSTTTSIKVEVISDGTTIGTSIINKILRGQIFAGNLNTLFINTNTARLDYNYRLYNQSASNSTLYIRITNTTKGQFAQMTHFLNANSEGYFYGTTGSMGIVNQLGDSFTIQGSLDAVTWYNFSTSTGTLNYGV